MGLGCRSGGGALGGCHTFGEDDIFVECRSEFEGFGGFLPRVVVDCERLVSGRLDGNERVDVQRPSISTILPFSSLYL